MRTVHLTRPGRTQRTWCDLPARGNLTTRGPHAANCTDCLDAWRAAGSPEIIAVGRPPTIRNTLGKPVSGRLTPDEVAMLADEQARSGCGLFEALRRRAFGG